MMATWRTGWPDAAVAAIPAALWSARPQRARDALIFALASTVQ